MVTGYCTLDDVRRALQEASLPGDIAQDNELAVDAIAGQSEWLRDRTEQHWYVPGGVGEDTKGLVPTEPRTRSDEDHDIPSTPHSPHSTLFSSQRARYPQKSAGPYSRVRLDKHHVDSLSALKVRDRSGGFDDWVADPDKQPDEDYRLYVEAGSTDAVAYVELHTGSLPPLAHYDHAVRVSYDYGRDKLPRTVRRAVAFRAASDFVEDAAIDIPDNARIQSVESKAEQLERKAEELLEVYR